MSNQKPLIVDLDGTLILTDNFYESLLFYLKNFPLNIFLLIIKLFRGKLELKKYLSNFYDFNPKYLPYNEELLNLLKKEKISNKRKIYICTGSVESIAKKIYKHLKIFDGVYYSDKTNLVGLNKSKFLTNKFGKDGFDYIGNSFTDIGVWKFSKEKIVTNASFLLKILLKNIYPNIRFIDKNNNNNFFFIWLSEIRIHQWCKNFLIFIPFLLEKDFSISNFFLYDNFTQLIITFFCLSVCASSVYIFNDLYDLNNDRQHQKKSERSIAAGLISIPVAFTTAVLMLSLSLIIAYILNNNIFNFILIYFILTCIYTVKIKSIILLDCIFLSILYTYRIFIGYMAINNFDIPFWLLIFSFMFFLSLAFLKRFVDISHINDKNSNRMLGRGYISSDKYLISTLGISSGVISSLVFFLYIYDSYYFDDFDDYFLILSSVTLFFWISWIWLSGFRNFVDSDPIVFALKNKVSVISAILFISLFLLGN